MPRVGGGRQPLEFGFEGWRLLVAGPPPGVAGLGSWVFGVGPWQAHPQAPTTCACLDYHWRWLGGPGAWRWLMAFGYGQDGPLPFGVGSGVGLPRWLMALGPSRPAPRVKDLSTVDFGVGSALALPLALAPLGQARPRAAGPWASALLRRWIGAGPPPGLALDLELALALARGRPAPGFGVGSGVGCGQARPRV